MEKITQSTKEILRRNGYKFTPQRKTIAEFLYNTQGRHMTSEEIYNELSPNFPDIGIATVYRTMQLFEKLRIVSRLTLDDGISRYELNDLSGDRHSHHHMICLKCDKILEFQEDLLDELERNIENELNFHIVDHSVKFYGLCNECQLKK
ncbi:MAG: Fur family transcriptional regulator [Tissierellia bacterium]|nr:Fur family transcriptional regulator [Tissierellia bacterium]